MRRLSANSSGGFIAVQVWSAGGSDEACGDLDRNRSKGLFVTQIVLVATFR